MKVLNEEFYRVPVFNWCPDVEENAMRQVDNIAQLFFVHKRVVILPDCHLGYGMPIGGVVALKNVISPNMVGSDIGCGMIAVETSLTEINTDTLKKIMGEIRKVIPVGFKRHEENKIDLSQKQWDSIDEYLDSKYEIV